VIERARCRKYKIVGTVVMLEEAANVIAFIAPM